MKMPQMKFWISLNRAYGSVAFGKVSLRYTAMSCWNIISIVPNRSAWKATTQILVIYLAKNTWITIKIAKRDEFNFITRFLLSPVQYFPA